MNKLLSFYTLFLCMIIFLADSNSIRQIGQDVGL